MTTNDDILNVSHRKTPVSGSEETVDKRISMAIAVYSLLLALIITIFLPLSVEFGFYHPTPFPFEDNSTTVLGTNIIDRRVFATTNRNGWLQLEIFDIIGADSEPSLTLIDSQNIGVNLTELFRLSSATDNLLVFGYSVTAPKIYIYERNSTSGQWEQVIAFDGVLLKAFIVSDTKILYNVASNWQNTANAIGCFSKINETWTIDEIASFRDVQYYNGTLIAANSDDLTVRIFEQVNETFVQVQQLPVIDSAALDTWGLKVFFSNEREFYFGNLNIGFGIPIFYHHFVRQDNGTWEYVGRIDSQYIFYSAAPINGNFVVSPGVLSSNVEALVLLVDMRTFNGTNPVAATIFPFVQGFPSDGPLDSTGQDYFTVINSDKKLYLFGLNQKCANGVKEDDEQCDSGLFCSEFCECSSNLTRSADQSVLDCVPSCGNGYLDINEQCDAYFVDTCHSDCTCQSGHEPTGNTTCQLICGNGVIDQGELCDPRMDENCDRSCLRCKNGYTLVTRTCDADEVQAPSVQSDAMPGYVIPVAVVVPVVVAAGIIVMIVLLVKRRNKRRRENENELTRLGDSKYVSISTTSSPNNSNGSKQPISELDNNLDIAYKDLILKREIGAGAFGKVFLGEWQRLQVALKFSSVGNTEEFKQEARLMINLRSHPNVVQVLGLSLDGPFPILILEYCDGGSLESSVKKKGLTDEQIIDYAFGIARGMLHLHLNNIVHRDLAARNILLDDDVPKISDFGMARFVSKYKEGKTGNSVGPLKWMAPESLAHQTYSIKSDMWSFGCILYEMVTGQEMYEDIQPVDIYHGVTRGQLRPPVPDSAPMVIRFIMTKCFDFDPNKRPTFEEVCNWLREPSQIQIQNPVVPLAVQTSQSVV